MTRPMSLGQTSPSTAELGPFLNSAADSRQDLRKRRWVNNWKSTTVAQTVVGGLNGSNNRCSPKDNGSLDSLREVSLSGRNRYGFVTSPNSCLISAVKESQ